MRSFLAAVSLVVSRCTGGKKGEYLCQRIGERYGPHCRFCRAVGFVLREPDHCATIMRDGDKS